MYLRCCYRDKDGKRHAYWALVESYRTARVSAWWRGWVPWTSEGAWVSSAANAGAGQAELFAASEEPEWAEVDLRGVRAERTRRFGGPWLGTPEKFRRVGWRRPPDVNAV